MGLYSVSASMMNLILVVSGGQADGPHTVQVHIWAGIHIRVDPRIVVLYCGSLLVLQEGKGYLDKMSGVAKETEKVQGEQILGWM